MRPWKLLFVGVLCVVLWGAWQVYQFFEFGIDNAYAQWGAGNMVVHFMKDHDGQWPRSWEDLRPYYDAGESRIGGWPYETFQRRIWIDWTAKPDALAAAAIQSDSPTFNVVAPADGIDVRWEGVSGNQIIHAYFRNKALGKNPAPAAKTMTNP